MCFVSVPVAKTKLKTKNRESFAACGESTTHELTYSKVPIRPMQSLPRLSKQAKADIINTPVENLLDLSGKAKKESQKGHAIFWQ